MCCLVLVWCCMCCSRARRDSVRTLGTRELSDEIHPVSITRFPLRRCSPGAGLLKIHLFIGSGERFSRGWIRKDGNLLTETGCRTFCSRALRNESRVVYIHMHTYTYICINLHTYTYIHIHIHTHAHTYTYSNTSPGIRYKVAPFSLSV